MQNGNSRTIYELLRMRAERDPDAIAIAAPGRHALTYRGLLGQADSVVRCLISMGVRHDDRIAIVLPNGPEMATAFLGAAAGAVCAPLNPAYSAGEFEFYLADLSPKALIVQCGIHSSATDVAAKYGIPVIEVLPDEAQAAGRFILTGNAEAIRSRAESAQAEDVALILHTSGTTSRPKMVPLTHANLLASAGNTTATLRLGRADCCLNVMPLFHIHGLVGALLSSVLAGASIICSPGFDAGEFFSWLDAFRATWYTAVPTIHHEVLSCARKAGSLSGGHSLRFIRSSSAALPACVLEGLETTFMVPVIESYGMTEAAHQMTSNPLPPFQRKVGSVGIAAGPEVSVMDETGNLLSPGEIGEIVIRGANVTRGYENNKAANAGAFTDRWFRTGDQGYIDADGYLFVSGRLKEIINRGGEKISPREVDEALLAHPNVSQAIAFAVPHSTLGEDVGAAIVLREKQGTTVEDIREYLGSRLAAYKMPSRILFVDDLPKGATGKIQRIGMAAKFADQLNGKFVALENELESEVARIYAEVLGVEQVGATDNFFALGGDSLRGTQLIARIRARFGVNLSIATIFLQSTVGELAQEILRLIATDEDSVTPDGTSE